ncbi:MAG: hypothetical protein KGL39_11335 [Patescibacteria group bacterium]|nr:hypothetical protein [Patescibacteria group bacterium]
MSGLPLFDEGPFSRSTVDPAPMEKVVAGLIFNRESIRPLAIADLVVMCGMSARQVKQTVEELRRTHHCAIGASRQEPSGYFWIRTAADRETAVRPYREQILTMWQTLRALDSPASLRELHGQLRLDG